MEPLKPLEPAAGKTGGLAKFWRDIEARAKSMRPIQGEQYVIFRAGGKKFAIKAARCLGVHSAGEICPLPDMPSHIGGLGVIEGEPTPVVDPSDFFGLGNRRKGAKSYFLAIAVEAVRVALLVGWVDDVVSVEDKLVVRKKVEWEGLPAGVIIGVIKDRDQEVYVIDPVGFIDKSRGWKS